MNKAVRNTLILRITTLFSGGLSLVLVPFFLTSNEQGYYYTFLSLVSIQVFFELGLSQVLIYVFSAQEKINIINRDDIQSATLYATKLFNKYAGILFFILSIILGFVFFNSNEYNDVSWQYPWIILVTCTSINLSQTSKLTYLEATGKMSYVSAMRTYQDILGIFILIILLLLGCGLWAVISLALSKAIITTYWLYSNPITISWRNKLKNKNFKKSYLFDVWKKEIFPMQWKISISWISGYFIFQFLTPLTFKIFGPTLAGQLGLSLNITTGLLLACTTFTTARSPEFAKLIVENNYLKLDRIFNKSLKFSIFSLSSLYLMMNITIYFSSEYIPFITNRILKPDLLYILCLSSLAKGVVYCLSTYLRAHRDDPYMPLSICTSILTILSVINFSKVSFKAMLFSYLIVSLISLLASIKIFSRYKKNCQFVSHKS